MKRTFKHHTCETEPIGPVPDRRLAASQLETQFPSPRRESQTHPYGRPWRFSDVANRYLLGPCRLIGEPVTTKLGFALRKLRPTRRDSNTDGVRLIVVDDFTYVRPLCFDTVYAEDASGGPGRR